MNIFQERQDKIRKEHEALLARKNKELYSINGIFHRYLHPILTRDHFPLEWRFDFNPAPLSGRAYTCWRYAARAMTGNHFLP
jgi:hypothetical protein